MQQQTVKLTAEQIMSIIDREIATAETSYRKECEMLKVTAGADYVNDRYYIQSISNIGRCIYDLKYIRDVIRREDNKV